MPKKSDTLFSYFNRTPKGKENKPAENVASGKSATKEATKPISGKQLNFTDVKVADLVWAKLEGYPWWPAIVCEHPATKTCVKDGGTKKSKVHVQFFEKDPTRSWVSHRYIAKYCGSDAKECQRGGRFHSSEPGWYDGTVMADKAMTSSEDERRALILDHNVSTDEEDNYDSDIFDAEMSDDDPEVIEDDDVQEVTPEEDGMADGGKNNNNTKPEKSESGEKTMVKRKSPEKKRKRKPSLHDSGSEDDYKPAHDDSSSSEDDDEGVSEKEESFEAEEPEHSEEDEPPPKKKQKVTQSRAVSRPSTDSVPTPVAGRTVSKLSSFACDTTEETGDQNTVETNFKHLNYDFLKPENIRDADKRRPGTEGYNSRTLHVPADFIQKQTPCQRQWWDIKSQNYDTVLFFKMGKFYELFHMDAVTGVAELNLIYMKGDLCHAGFPEVAFSRYADMLIKRGFKVARVEQTETPEGMEQRTKGMKGKDKVVRREVCAVQTAGVRKYSFIDGDPCISTYTYLLALTEKLTGAVDHGRCYGVCFIDTSIGEFHLGQFMDDRHSSRLRTLISQSPPAQILFDRDNVADDTLNVLRRSLPSAELESLGSPREFWDSLTTVKHIVKQEYFQKEDKVQWPENLNMMLENADSASVMVKNDYNLCISALGAIIWYLTRCRMDEELLSMRRVALYSPPDVDSPEAFSSPHLILDGVTLDNLDLLPPPVVEEGQPQPQETDGCLLTRLDSCRSAPGRRLLRQWVCAPLTDVTAIRARQEALADLMTSQAMTEEIREKLATLPDLPRLLSKIHTLGLQSRCEDHPDGRAVFMDELVYNKKKVEDFLTTLAGFRTGYQIIKQLATKRLDFKSTLLKPMTEFVNDVAEEGYPQIKEKLKYFDESFDHDVARKQGIITPRRGVDPDYDQAVDDIKQTTNYLEDYIKEQRASMGVAKITYWGRGKDRFQMEIPDTIKKLPPDFELTSSRKGFRRYRSGAVVRMFRDLTDAEDRRDLALKDSMRRIFHQFDEDYAVWHAAARCLATLDVLLALAEYSRCGEATMCRPVLHTPGDKPFISIREGRHPCVSGITSEDFIPNDTFIGEEPDCDESSDERLVLVTGPNMGGKSTLMRQVGLLVILAQMGCYVPAERMSLTPVDRVFTRLGAADDILAGESTFYVELSETSAILQHATTHSLVLLDELGRGTATYDGTAIASAVVHTLSTDLRCRVLFSTHYHGLVTQYQRHPGVRLGHMSCMVEDDDDDLDEQAVVTREVKEESITFLYKFVPGACPRSYGFNAARLAGLPDKVIRDAFLKARQFYTSRNQLENFRNLCLSKNVSDIRATISTLKSS